MVFQDANAGAALAASLRAALANWKALAVYGMGVFFYAGVVPVSSHALPSSCCRGGAAVLAIALLLPYWLFLAATLHVSDYVSYRDVFHASETLAPITTGGVGACRTCFRACDGGALGAVQGASPKAYEMYGEGE